MKTKAILVAGLLMAASAVSSMAQVFSVNAVGFVNVVLPPGFSLICNPLNATANTVPALFPGVPFGTSIFKFNPATGSFIGNSFLGGWTDPTMTLVPGEGFFFKNPSGTTPITNTFVGNVQQGTLVTSLSPGFQIVSSQVPQAGLVSTDLGLPIANGESVFTFNNALNRYDGATLLGMWGAPGEPTIAVGQAFFVKKISATSWTRVFSVNQ